MLVSDAFSRIDTGSFIVRTFTFLIEFWFKKPIPVNSVTEIKKARNMFLFKIRHTLSGRT